MPVESMEPYKKKPSLKIIGANDMDSMGGAFPRLMGHQDTFYTAGLSDCDAIFLLSEWQVNEKQFSYVLGFHAGGGIRSMDKIDDFFSVVIRPETSRIIVVGGTLNTSFHAQNTIWNFVEDARARCGVQQIDIDYFYGINAVSINRKGDVKLQKPGQPSIKFS